MAGPITWRNVSGPSPAEAARPLQIAQQSFNGAFDALGNIIKQREATDASNVLATDEAAKQAFLERLNGARTPDELTAMQPDILAARAALSPRNQAATRGADEARIASLRTNITAGNKFADDQLDREQAPIRDSILSAAQRDPAKALALIEANPGLRNAAELHKAITNREQDLTRFGWEKDRHGFAVDQNQRANAADARSAQSHGINIQTSQLQLNEAQQKAADNEEVRRLETRLADFASNYQASTAGARSAIEGEAAAFKDLPRNGDGSLNVNRMTPEQKAALNTRLTAKGLPTTDIIETGDTEATRNFLTTLREEGVRPSTIARIQSQVGPALSTAPQALVGNDADNAARAARVSEAEDEVLADRYGSISTKPHQDKLLKRGMEMISAITKPGSMARDRYTRALGTWIDEGGIPTGDGGKILPSEGQLATLLSKVDSGTFGINSFQSDITDVLNKWQNDPENIKGAAELLKSKLKNQLREVNKDPGSKK